jgi:hypothetical protein
MKISVIEMSKTKIYPESPKTHRPILDKKNTALAVRNTHSVFTISYIKKVNNTQIGYRRIFRKMRNKILRKN